MEIENIIIEKNNIGMSIDEISKEVQIDEPIIVLILKNNGIRVPSETIEKIIVKIKYDINKNLSLHNEKEVYKLINQLSILKNCDLNFIENKKLLEILRLKHTGESIKRIAEEVNMSVGYVFNSLKEFIEPLQFKRNDKLILNHIEIPQEYNINDFNKIIEEINKKYSLDEDIKNISICKTIKDLIESLAEHKKNISNYNDIKKELILNYNITILINFSEQFLIEIAYKKNNNKNKRYTFKSYATINGAINFLRRVEIELNKSILT